MTWIRWTIASLMVLAFGGGCGGARVSLNKWQKNLEGYVEAHQNDPNVLRDVTVSGNRRGFAVIGGVDPRKSTDARAVLLGHSMVGQRPWFVYLVGIVDEQKAEDIRLAAVSFGRGGPIWRFSKENDQALQRYQNHNRDLFRALHTQRSRVPAEYLSFPRDADRFNLAINDRQLDATHEGSGAQWRLVLP